MIELSVAEAEVSTSSTASSAESFGTRLLKPVDAARVVILRFLARIFGPTIMRPLVVNRELRVALSGVLSLGVALFMTIYCPLLLLIISPLLLGVPHLLSDVRYLVAQPGYHRRLRLAVPVGLALAGAGLGLGMASGLIAILAAICLCGGGYGKLAIGKRVLGGVAVAALLYVGWSSSFYWLELGLAHLHNFVAVLLFYLWRPQGVSRKGRLHIWPVALFVVGVAALFSGVLAASPRALSGFADYNDLSADGQRDLLAPLLPFVWSTRLLLVFAFAQAVHYTIWLRLIPEEARSRKAPRPFRASLIALHRDLGGTLLALATAVGVTLAIWATLDLAAARTGYFRLALFHGYLEICVLAVWWIEGQRGADQKRIAE